MLLKRLQYYFSRFWLAIAVASYLFMPYASRYVVGLNRFKFFWTWYDLAALILCIISLGSFFFLFFLCLRGFGNVFLRKLFEIGFVAVFGVAVFANAHHAVKYLLMRSEIKPEGLWLGLLDNASILCIALLVVLMSFAFFARSLKIYKKCMACCFVFSTVLPIFAGNALFYKQIAYKALPHVPEVVRNATRSSGAKGNVYFFIFDEWSYVRSFEKNELIEPFVHLKQFQKQSVYFREAFSYAPMTLNSIPSILYQAGHQFVINKNSIGFQQDRFVPLGQMSHLFTHPRQLGYYTAMVGNYVPVRELLQDDIDFSFSASHGKLLGMGFFDVAGQHLYEAGLKLLMGYESHRIDIITGYFLNRFSVRLNNKIDALTKKIIADVSVPTFAVFHYVIPHGPFIYKREGPISFFKRADYVGASGYYNNLEFLDEKIGEIIELCKRVDKYDQSLIIMTSDHSWRFDNKAALKDMFHVPLFIKLPYQKAPIEIHSPFSIIKLGMVVQSYMDGTLDVSNIEEILNDSSFYVPPRLPTEEEIQSLKTLL